MEIAADQAVRWKRGIANIGPKLDGSVEIAACIYEEVSELVCIEAGTAHQPSSLILGSS